MFKQKKPISLLPYLGLVCMALIIQLFMPEDKQYVTISYLPETATEPVTYQVQHEGVQRIGDCITFQNKEKEGITLCDRYEIKP